MFSHLPTLGKRQRWIVYLLLLLAAVHCTLSIFCMNYSYLNLAAYAAGTEQMPYQGRVAMMWVLRLAEHSPTITAAAHTLDNSLRAHHKNSTLVGITPEKLVCMVVGLASMSMIVLAALWYGQRRLARVWWLPATLTLVMFYVTYAARYETTLWYPYDLPHYAVFGMATLAILEGAWWPVFLLFAIDTPIRETAIYLAPLSFLVAWARGEKKQGAILMGAMFALWIPFRLFVNRAFAHNGSETGVHYHRLRDSLMNPMHWPQSASAFAFLLLPLWWGRKRLSRIERSFLFGTLVCILATLGFAVWSETRVFDEWILALAALMAAECVTWFADEQVVAVKDVQEEMHQEFATIGD
jgi:hypothetical protein